MARAGAAVSAPLTRRRAASYVRPSPPRVVAGSPDGAEAWAVDPERLALVQGMRDTRMTLNRWQAAPSRVLGPWLLGGLTIATVLLVGVWAIATAVNPDVSTTLLPGLNEPVDAAAIGRILFRNSLVLALHGFACVAGFIAGSSLPLQAEYHTGLWKKVHDKAGPLAISFVGAATLFSLLTQAWVLGRTASDLALQLDVSTGMLMLTLLPHALLELTALFVPLAAWLIASRRDGWHELLAATFATVGLAIPALLVAALIEVTVWPELLRLVSAKY